MSDFMVSDPAVPASNTKDLFSFAYATVRERWPKILNAAIDDIETNFNCLESISHVDATAGRRIQSQMAELRSELHAGAVLKLLPDDGGPDVWQYNEELKALHGASWHSIPWLFAECYMYRKMHTFFSTSTAFWQSYDIFGNEKKLGLEGSKKGTIELIKHFHEMRRAIANGDVFDSEAQKAIFEDVVQISLWGNATDLSMLTTMSVGELNSRQGKAARENARKNILANDTDLVWNLLSTAKSTSSIGDIHLVLDNAGYELLSDLVLAGYLIDSGFARRVILHGKRIPWFVSDVNRHDLMILIDSLADGTIYEDVCDVDKQELMEAGRYWHELINSGKMEFRAHPFWTTAHPFGRMGDIEPELFDQITSAKLVIYKGDLNYRKLVYDCYWPKTTPFSKALGVLGETRNGKGSRTFAIRTSKGDVCVGLAPGLEEELEDGWTRTGKYAVASYHDGKFRM